MSKAQKNLQFAKDLNEEMELMFADDDYTPPSMKPTGKANKKKKDGKQKNQV